MSTTPFAIAPDDDRLVLHSYRPAGSPSYAGLPSAQPIVLWQAGNQLHVVDGARRLTAAALNGCKVDAAVVEDVRSAVPLVDEGPDWSGYKELNTLERVLRLSLLMDLDAPAADRARREAQSGSWKTRRGERQPSGRGNGMDRFEQQLSGLWGMPITPLLHLNRLARRYRSGDEAEKAYIVAGCARVDAGQIGLSGLVETLSPSSRRYWRRERVSDPATVNAHLANIASVARQLGEAIEQLDPDVVRHAYNRPDAAAALRRLHGSLHTSTITRKES